MFCPQGMRLSSVDDSNGLGFLFFYEMFTGSINFKFSSAASTHSMASVLMRLMPEGDTESGLLMSILRVLDENADAARAAPKFALKEQSVFDGIGTMLYGDNPHIHTFVLSVVEFLQVTVTVAVTHPISSTRPQRLIASHCCGDVAWSRHALFSSSHLQNRVDYTFQWS